MGVRPHEKVEYTLPSLDGVYEQDRLGEVLASEAMPPRLRLLDALEVTIHPIVVGHGNPFETTELLEGGTGVIEYQPRA